MRLRQTRFKLPAIIHGLYTKIAEPRVRRLVYFGIYNLLMVAASVSLFFKVPSAFENVLGGRLLVYFCGILIVLGTLVCALSVLPGIWVFERAGLVAIIAGIIMYTITLIVLGASAMVTVVPAIFILFLALRWLDIWEFLLAPRKG